MGNELRVTYRAAVRGTSFSCKSRRGERSVALSSLRHGEWKCPRLDFPLLSGPAGVDWGFRA